MKWIFTCKINKKTCIYELKKKHVTLLSMKSRFKTKLYIKLNAIGRSYLIN